MKTRVSQFWRTLGSQLVSSVAMSEDFTQFIVFLFARCFLGEFFWRFSALQCLAKQRKMSATFSQFQYACIVLWNLPQVLQQQETYKWTLSFYGHGPPCFKFENNTSGRARLWDTALKFLAEAFSWRHQITWRTFVNSFRKQIMNRAFYTF